VRWVVLCTLVALARPVAAQGLGLRARFDLDPLHAMAPELPPGNAIAIRVEGLTVEALRLLERTRRAGDSLVRVPASSEEVDVETWELWTSSERYVEWLREFQVLARDELGPRLPVMRWRSLTVCVVDNGSGSPLMAETSLRLLSRVDDGARRPQLRGPETLWMKPVEESGVHSERYEIGWKHVQRAMLRVTAAIEATRIDPNRRDRVADGVRGGVRVLKHLELGGGYRRLPAEIKGGNHQGDVTWASVVFARVGFHIEPGGRLAVPLAVDVGRGASIEFHLRVHTGVRIRLSRVLFLGLNIADPTYTVYQPSANTPLDSGWDMRSTAEMTAEF
jgi:hypothetical protein